MNKITMALIGIGAAGAVGAGGYIALQPSAPETPNPTVEAPADPATQDSAEQPDPAAVSGASSDVVGRSLYGTPFEMQLWVRKAGTEPDRALLQVGRGVCFLPLGAASSCAAASQSENGLSAAASLVSSGNGTLQLKLAIQILIKNAFLPDQARRQGIGAKDGTPIPASARRMALSDNQDIPMRTNGEIAEILLPPDSIGFEVSVPFHHNGDAGEDITDPDQVGFLVARFVPVDARAADFSGGDASVVGASLSVKVTRHLDGKTESSHSVCSLTVETPCVVVHEGKRSNASMRIQALGTDAVHISLMIDDLGIDLLPLAPQVTFAGETALAVTRPRTEYDHDIPHVAANRIVEILIPSGAAGKEILVPYVIGPKPNLSDLDPRTTGTLSMLLQSVGG
ncbi:MAG: hypothetical protein RLW87_20415 [Alphaproteobacteria bacterium]